MSLSHTTLAACLLALPVAAGQALAPTSEVDLAETGVQMLALPAQAGQPFLVDVEIDGVPHSLDLAPYSLRAADFELRVQDADGLQWVEAPAPTTYRGTVVGVPGSDVRASLEDGLLRGTIRDAAGNLWGVQPATDYDPSAAPGAHVVYHQSQVRTDSHVCGLVTDPIDPDQTPGPGYAGTGVKIAEIAFDADTNFYNQNGGSVAATVADIENVMNSVESIYENDVDVTFEIRVIIVRTSEPDPYSTTNSSALLNQLSSEWIQNQNGYKRDLTHLMTGKNLDGSTIGIAQLGSLCSAYGLSQSKFSGSLTFRAGLTAHEVGHNFNAQHCDGDPQGCRIMCSGLGGCGPVTSFAPGPINRITNKANQVSCLTDLGPPISPPFQEPFAAAVIDTDTWIMNDGAVVTTNASNEPSAPYSLELNAVGPAAVDQDEVRTNEFLVGTSGPWFVTFYTQHTGVEAGESLVVDYLQIGGTAWAELVRITSDGVNQTSFTPTTLGVPSFGWHDGLRLRFRTEGDESNDLWYVDEVSLAPVPPCLLPFPYCTGKMSSEGCVPTVVATGSPSLTDPTPFEVQAFLTIALKPGLMFYGYGPAALPFQDGTLCVQPPTRRTTTQLSGGTPGFPCDGDYVFDMNALIQSGLDPFLVEGQTFNCQYWFRDNGVASQTGLTNGLQSVVCP